MAEADDEAGLRKRRDTAAGVDRFRRDRGQQRRQAAARAAISAAWSASVIGRISAGSCAPLRAIDRCGPSRCRPRKPGTLPPRRLGPGGDGRAP